MNLSNEQKGTLVDGLYGPIYCRRVSCDRLIRRGFFTEADASGRSRLTREGRALALSLADAGVRGATCTGPVPGLPGSRRARVTG